MIEIKDVSFSYDTSRVILKNISADFFEGRTYSIFGPSGSGKSTLLSLLGGIETPDQGTIYIDGKDITHLDGAQVRRTLVSFVFQDFLLFPFLSALENVEVAYEICNPAKKDQGEIAKHLLSEVELSESLFNKKVRHLSIEVGENSRNIIMKVYLIISMGIIIAYLMNDYLKYKETMRIYSLLGEKARYIVYEYCIRLFLLFAVSDIFSVLLVLPFQPFLAKSLIIHLTQPLSQGSLLTDFEMQRNLLLHDDSYKVSGKEIIFLGLCVLAPFLAFLSISMTRSYQKLKQRIFLRK